MALVSLAVLGALGCTTEDVDVPTETTSGAGESSSATANGTSNTTGNASSTTGGTECEPMELCAPLVVDEPDLVDFSQSPRPGLSLYSYSEKVSNEVTEDDEWHIAGEVDDYSGFGIDFPCVSDVSAFKGVAFDIRGSVGAASIALSANTASNSDKSCEHPHRTCAAGCANSQAVIPLTEQMRTISFEWDDFSGGSPNDHPDPSELISLVWVFRWKQGDHYAVDVTVDNVHFIE